MVSHPQCGATVLAMFKYDYFGSFRHNGRNYGRKVILPHGEKYAEFRDVFEDVFDIEQTFAKVKVAVKRMILWSKISF